MKTKKLVSLNQKSAYAQLSQQIAEFVNREDVTVDELNALSTAMRTLTSMVLAQAKIALIDTQIQNKPVQIERIERFVGTSVDPEAPHFE